MSQSQGRNTHKAPLWHHKGIFSPPDLCVLVHILERWACKSSQRLLSSLEFTYRYIVGFFCPKSVSYYWKTFKKWRGQYLERVSKDDLAKHRALKISAAQLYCNLPHKSSHVGRQTECSLQQQLHSITPSLSFRNRTELQHKHWVGWGWWWCPSCLLVVLPGWAGPPALARWALVRRPIL